MKFAVTPLVLTPFVPFRDPRELVVAAGGAVPVPGRGVVTLGPPKRGVSKPTVYTCPQLPLYNNNKPSCLGQWSATY